MECVIASRPVVRAVLLGAVSFLALSLGFRSSQKVYAQSTLPPVTVDPPASQNHDRLFSARNHRVSAREGELLPQRRATSLPCRI